MTKKFFSFFLALIAGAGTVFASNTQVDGIWYNFNSSSNTASVTYRGDTYNSYNNEYSGAVIIPSSVEYGGNTYNVTSVGYDAFYGCSSLTSIEIPNSVTSIGDEAFYGCSGLTSVTIGNSVTSIYSSTFSDCNSLTSVTLNSNAIVSQTYTSSSNISSIFGSQVEEYVIGENVTSIGDYAFHGCSGLTSVTIGNSVTNIGGSAFYGCSSLKEVHISDLSAWCAINFSTYDANPLLYAHNLYVNGELVKDLVIPNNVTRIRNYAFYYCYRLESVTIPSSVTSIGKSAFSFCSGLTSIEIPNSVTSIGDYAFHYCGGLTSVTIGNGVTSIGNCAFRYCYRLESLSLGENITSYGEYAFSGCSALTSIYNYRERPAKLGAGAFDGIDYFNCTLYVLAGSVDMYKSTGSDWKDFYFVESIGATDVTADIVKVTAHDNTADIVWPTVTDAVIYELTIRDKYGEEVCTLIFDSEGRLTSIAFHAPARNNAPQQTTEQVAGFEFTITGLDSGTTYQYTITSKDSNGNVLDTKTGTFRTEGGTAVIYTLTVNSDDAMMGTVSGSGEYEEGEEVTITASPADGYRFVEWSDGNTDNPRTIILTEDLTLTAYFEQIIDGLHDADADTHIPNVRKVFIDGNVYILMPDGSMFDANGKKLMK